MFTFIYHNKPLSFFPSYELLLVKKGKYVNRDTFSDFHFYQSQLLFFFQDMCVFVKNHQQIDLRSKLGLKKVTLN